MAPAEAQVDTLELREARAPREAYARQAFDNWCCRRHPHDPQGAVCPKWAINPSAHVGGAVNPGGTVRGAVERGIPGPDLGTWRSPSGQVHRGCKHSTTATKQRRRGH